MVYRSRELDGLQLPHRERSAAADPEAGPGLVERAAQVIAIPAAAAQVHLGIRPGAITVVLPVEPGERGEVQHPATQAREVREGALSCARVQILQHVIADHEIERRRGAEAL